MRGRYAQMGRLRCPKHAGICDQCVGAQMGEVRCCCFRGVADVDLIMGVQLPAEGAC